MSQRIFIRITTFLLVFCFSAFAVQAQNAQVAQLSMKDADWQSSARGFTTQGEGLRSNDGAGASLVSTPFAITVADDAPFISYHMVWHGRNLLDAVLQQEYSTSPNGINWSEWKPAPFDGHDEQGAERMVSHQQLLPADARYLRFRLNVSGTALLERTEVHFFNPGKTPEKPKKYKAPHTHRVQEDCAKPEVISREAWDALERSESGISTSEVTHLIVHHEAGSNESSDWAARVRAIQYFHINGNGWYDIGYNFLVDPNGNIYEGRVGGDDAIGAHYCARNRNTMGVCMLGDYSVIEPTIAAQQGLHKILAWKAAKETIDPLASSYHYSVGDLPHIAGHRDGGCTFCPGDGMYGLLGNVRQSVDSLISNGCPGVGGSPDTIPPSISLRLPGGSTYNDDFIAIMENADDRGTSTGYYLTHQSVGDQYEANGRAGFLSTHFAFRLPQGTSASGDYVIDQGILYLGGGLLHLPVEQTETGNLFKTRFRLTDVGTDASLAFYLRGASVFQSELGQAYKLSILPAQSRMVLSRVSGNVPDDKVIAERIFSLNQWTELWCTVDPQSGAVTVWLDEEKLLTWADDVPLESGAFVSIRGESIQAEFEDASLWKERTSGETLITVGPREDADFPWYGGGEIFTQAVDLAGNWSSIRRSLVFINIDDRVVTGFGIYPNPLGGGDDLTLLVPEQNRAVLGLQLLAVTGQEVYRGELQLQAGQSAYTLSSLLTGLDNGQYILHISTGTGTKQLSLLINR